MNHLFYRIKKDLCISTIISNINENDCCFMEEFLNTMNNPNMCMLIIESMSTCIVMTDHIAMQFGYIRMLYSKNEYRTYKKFKIKIFKIDNTWDTSKWKLTIIHKFYVHFCQIENNSISFIRELLVQHPWYKEYINIDFLESLSWGPYEINN